MSVLTLLFHIRRQTAQQITFSHQRKLGIAWYTCRGRHWAVSFIFHCSSQVTDILIFHTWRAGSSTVQHMTDRGTFFDILFLILKHVGWWRQWQEVQRQTFLWMKVILSKQKSPTYLWTHQYCLKHSGLLYTMNTSLMHSPHTFTFWWWISVRMLKAGS